MEQIKESNINRILSHMKDKDIATITAFRTDPELEFSKTKNKERNKVLEEKLKSMGYKGFTKIVGYWDETPTPEDENSKAVAKESYFVLNTGSTLEGFITDMISLMKDVENKGFDQQAIVVWSHKDQEAYLFDKNGNILRTFNNFNIDTVSQGWSQIKGHKLTFVEESFSDFEDSFNKNGNWMSAMGYKARKKE